MQHTATQKPREQQASGGIVETQMPPRPLGVERVLNQLREAAVVLEHYYPLLPPGERERLRAEVEGLLAEIRAAVAAEAAAARPQGIGSRIKRFFAAMRQRAVVNSLPALIAATPELPSELVARYLDSYQGGYSPEQDYNIRLLFLRVKQLNPQEYNKVVKLLSAGPPWSIWAVAVIDRVANRRATVPLTLTRLWTEFVAWSTRDIYYVIERLRALGRGDLAEKIWRLIIDSQRGDTEAKQLLEQVKKIVYNTPPEPGTYTLLTPYKITLLAELLGQGENRESRLHA